VCNFYGGPHHKKIWKAKNVQNSARFRTTLDFDREYLRDASIDRQAKNGVFINYNPSRVRQKIANSVRYNNRVYAANVYLPKINFIGRRYSGNFGLQGVLPPQMCTQAREWPRLASAHPIGNGGLPDFRTIFNNENSKIGLKFSI